ncbi:MAG: hypothetical protein K2N16_07250 [Muribaculaceae bacterium]|nr:hypothetical protein [Muribaculaceae bacterium]
MKKTILTLIIILCAAAAATAQRQPRGEVTPEQRTEWMQQYRDFKHKYLIRMLHLTDEQQGPFFAAYDQMDDELAAISQQTREIEQKYLAEDADFADEEYTEAARQLFMLKGKESKIEIDCFERIKDVLTPRQLVQLKSVERDFTKRLQKQRHEK